MHGISRLAITVGLVTTSLALEATQDIAVDPKWSVYLTDIIRSPKGVSASLYNKQDALTIPLGVDETESKFQIRDLAGGTRFEGKVLHIGGRDILFQSEGKNYSLHLGQTLGTALEKPVSADEAATLKRDTPPQPGQKTFSVEMRSKPWGSVFEWLANETGMRSIAGTYFPQGTFTFIPPANKTYSLPELMDIMNDALLQQGFVIIRDDQSFRVVPANDPIDPSILPRVKPDELGQRGNNELVTVTVPLGEMEASEIIADVRGLMGPFGTATSLARTNELLLQDTAGNLKRVVETIKEVVAKRPAKTDEKSWNLELRNRTWPEVFGWLTEQTGLPVVGQTKPTGSFTFVGGEKTYTLPEIVDVINEGLQPQQLLLVRRGHSFALAASDEPVDPAFVPRVKVSDLRTRGNSELVSIMLPVTNLSADDVAMEVERILSPLGRAVPLAKANQVILQDTAGNLKRIIETVRAMEEKAPRRR